MFLKVHRSRDTGDIVAVCDRELLNTTVRHEKLTVTITDSFYGNTPATEDEVKEALYAIDVHLIRAGKFKSADEPFVRRDMSTVQ